MQSTNSVISRRAVIAMMASSGLVRFSPSAFAQGYPDRPVKIIAPHAPGGPSDTMARLIAAKLSENTGKQFYVENQGAGGGNVGTAMVARSAPDGMTILLAGTHFVINSSLYKKPNYDPLGDFAPITIVSDSPSVIVAHPSLPAKNLKDLVELIKANPGKYSYASGGTGTLAQLSAELLKLTYGLNLTHVPHRSAGPAVQAVLGGHIPLASVTLPPTLPLIAEGKLRGLAVTGKSRFPTAPDIPTMTELGIPDQQDCNWQSVMAPAGTPQPIIDFLYREIVKIKREPGMKERFIQLGFTPIDTTPQQMAEQIKTELRKWEKVIREAKIDPI